ncbi:RNase P subunit p30-domain-containing protein [Astrocystis sublimbata]|nr:RNase P subunit p30-domain-containing protein [Astrocystis sublimbata]KAI0203437.1 RNase P subunit p30-domain-containing protein [Astrocystis sublimbata]
MLYDLNIAWSPNTSAADLERTLRFSASLGYDVVALNHTIGAPVPPIVTNPLPIYDPPSATATVISSSSSTSPSTVQPKLPTILRRATLVLSESAQNHRLPQLVSAYDILAVRPVTDDSFQSACLKLDEISIISLDLTVRQPFTLRPKPCMAAVARGVRFEVCYSQVLQGPAPAHILGSKGSKDGGGGGGSGGHTGGAGTIVDARARATFIGNVSSLIRATRGRGIIISSEAKSVLGLRAPADVLNLLNVWGLSSDRATEGIGPLPRGVVVNEGLKRSGFRGVVNIVGHADREKADVEMAEAGDGSAQVALGKPQDKKGKKNKNQDMNNNGAKKRKTGDGTNNPAPTHVNENTTPAGEGEEPPMRKRQAKKLKAALRNKQADGSVANA